MGKYVLKAAKSGFHFNLCAGNNQVIGTSEIYKTQKAALNGCAAIKKVAGKADIEDQTLLKPVAKKAPKFEIYFDKKKEYRFRLKSTNGEIILASEGYKSKDSCKNGIKSVKTNASSEVVDTTKA